MEFLREAIRLAREGVRAGEGGPFGAVVVKDSRIVGRGWNRVIAANDPTAHAEIVAIRDACARLGTFRLDGCEIYASCEPCPMCHAAIAWARIRRIVHAASAKDAAAAGFADADVRREIGAPPPAKRIAMERALTEEGLAPFRDWLEKADRVDY